MKTKQTYGIWAILAYAFLVSCTSKNLKVDIQINIEETPVRLALEKLNEVAAASNFEISAVNSDLIIAGTIDTTLDSEEAYSIRQKGKNVNVIGGGATGLVYGLYDVKKYLSEGKTSQS